MKKWYQSKTIWVNAAALAIPVLSTIAAQLHIIEAQISADLYAGIGFALPVINVILRAVTTTPISR